MSFAEPEPGIVDIPDDLLARVKPELRPGERLVWAGRPVRVPPLSRGSLTWAFGCLGVLYSLGIVLLLISVGTFGLLFEPIDLFSGFGTLFSLLAVIATIGWSIGGISDLADRRRVGREFYALSDQRALIWTPGETPQATQFFSHDRGHFDRINREERPDGSGSLTFSNSRNRFNPGPKQFREVADVKRVEALARQFVIAETHDKDEPTIPDPTSIRRDIDT